MFMVIIYQELKNDIANINYKQKRLHFYYKYDYIDCIIKMFIIRLQM